MTLEIIRVASKRELAAFIATPRRIYADDKRYVAPLDEERKELLDPKKAAFFKHGRAAYFLARRNGQPVGRISAQIDEMSDQTGRMETGHFGCFDVADDAEVADALIQAAETHLKQEGRTRVEGPHLLSINGEAGLLVDGFETAPMTLVPWHPPHASGHLARNGYDIAKRLHSYSLDLIANDPETMVADGLNGALVGLDCVVRSLRMNDLKAEAQIGRVLFNSAWQKNWGFVPLDQTDMDGFAEGFGQILDEDCAVMVEIDGKAVAFGMILPNVFNLFGDMNGTLGPLKIAKLLYRSWKRPWDSGRLCLFGVAEEHQGLLGAAIAVTMVKELAGRAKRRGLSWFEAGWVLEDNRPIIAMLRRTGFVRTRTHAVFSKAL